MGQPEKKIMIGRWNGYHGSTLAATALGGMKFMHEMGGTIPDVAHIDEPYWFAHEGDLSPAEFGLRAPGNWKKDSRTGRRQGRRVRRRTVPGRWRHDLPAGKLLAGNPAHLPQVRRAAVRRRSDWRLWPHRRMVCPPAFGFQPDTLSIAKGLTSGYIPMGGLVLSRRMAEALVEQGGVFAHGLTYSGHPVAAAVAIANLKACAMKAWSRR
jgi:hypothetical protein